MGMKNLGVTHTMLCWYFGNYPGLMNRAAGELSFEPFPKDEDTFLHQLAAFYWKEEDVPEIVNIWKCFSEGYENYPMINRFQWYGPMHDGPVWPLLIKPLDAPLSPTWEISSGSTLKPWPPSGDRIGECIGNVLTLNETVELCCRMSMAWDKGLSMLDQLEPKYINEPERILDMGVAKAIGIQFRSGYNILRFYSLREKMFCMEGRERLVILKQLSDIIREELENDQKLLTLCEKDSRLGFHSEAEGYKYFPAKIRWRMNQLKKVLSSDVPELEQLIRNNQPLFPEYTGKVPLGEVAYAIPSAAESSWSPGVEFVLPKGLKWQTCRYGTEKSGIQWAATYDADALYIIVTDSDRQNHSILPSPISGVTVKIEPRRLWSCIRYNFDFNSGNKNQEKDAVIIVRQSDKVYFVVRIPNKGYRWSDEVQHPIRMDLIINLNNGGTTSWRRHHPLTDRLVFGTDNPADLGWLMFCK